MGLAAVVAGLLEADWLPEQVTNWLSVVYLDDEVMGVSCETIYRSLLVQTRGGLR